MLKAAVLIALLSGCYLTRASAVRADVRWQLSTCERGHDGDACRADAERQCLKEGLEKDCGR